MVVYIKISGQATDNPSVTSNQILYIETKHEVIGRVS